MQTTGDKLQKLLTLVVTWALLLGFFFAFDRYFVAGQRDFLIDRHFRSLSALSGELNAEFERARISAESSLKLVAAASKQARAKGRLLDCQNVSNIQPCFRNFVEIYLGEVLVREKPSIAVPKCWGPDPNRIPLEAVAADGRLILNVRCYSSADPKKTGSPNPSSAVPVYTLDMTPWVRRAFQHLGDPFEDVLLADASGRVLFQRSTTEAQIVDLSLIVAKSMELGPRQTIVASPGAASQQHPSAPKLEQGAAATPGDGAPPKETGSAAKEFDRLLVGTDFRRAVIGGKNYELFSQPAHVVLGNYPAGGTIWPLVLLGLRRTSNIDAESRSLPYSTLIWVALSATVLLSLSWPLFKLRFMSNTERFSPRDGWYLILALFLMATAATLILLNASYLSQSRNTDDDAMKALAGKIKENFGAEVRGAFKQLSAVRYDPVYAEARKNAEAPGLYGSYLSAARVALGYPYFEIVFWANCNGNQLLKLDVRAAPTPPTNVSSFAFFSRLKSDIEWGEPRAVGADAKGSNAKDQWTSCSAVPAELDREEHAYVQPVISPNTDEFAPALAAPFAGDRDPDESERIAVQVLALRPMSVVDPVLPPGYAFAVIDSQCGVLFHSDSFRDMRENFCEESKNKTELRPWLVGGVNTPLNISYAGRTQRAYLTSFPLPRLASQGNAFLVVFREGEGPVTLNLAIILVCSILLGAYFLFLTALAGLHLSLRTPLQWIYAPTFIWPGHEYAIAYVRLFCANVLLFFLYVLAYSRLYEAPLLLLTAEVVILCVLFGYASLFYSPRFLFHLGITLMSIAALALLALGFSYLLLGPALLEWKALFFVLGAAGFFAFFVSGQWSWTKRLSNGRTAARLFDVVQAHFTGGYALAAVSMLACLALVPCLGFFKYAYDAVSEISLKHDQAVLSQSLLERRDRIRSYYETLLAPEIASRRMQEVWDRYDKGFYQISCEPNLSYVSSDDCTDNRETSKPSFTDWLNDRIEKQIARATLTFPSNETGSEMSRLGVASTNDADAWERSWREVTPTYFRLRWKPASRLPNLVVASSYPKWNGMTVGAFGYLVLFLAGLVFWLTRLTRQIFLTKVESAPAIRTVDWRAVSDIKTNYLVIGRAQSGKTERLRALSGLDRDAWRNLRTEVAAMIKGQEQPNSSRRGSLMILDHFEFNIRDRACNLARLELIESLLYDAHCRLVIVSTVDPLYFLTEEASKVLSDGKDPEEARRLVDRWARVLSNFTKVNLASPKTEEFLQKVGQVAELSSHHAQFAAWTFDECTGTALLRRLGLGLLSEFQNRPPATRDQLVEIVLDRAGAYYHVLWSGLTAAERLVLYQLALDGWANPKNTPAIQQLERKQLICRAPMYRVMNNSFRRFIQSTEHAAEIAEWERYEQQSTWKAFRFVIIAVVIGAGVWLLYAQAQLFQIGTGYITAIATLLTALAGFSARFKRSVPQQSEPAT